MTYTEILLLLHDQAGRTRGVDEDNRLGQLPTVSVGTAADRIGTLLPGLDETRFHRATTFVARLSAARQLLQDRINRLEGDRNRYGRFTIPRLMATTLLTLGDLARLLPPAEKRLLEHLQSGEPYDAIIGKPGFRSVKRRDERLRLLLSRIRAYCGTAEYRRFVRRHLSKRRPGRPRTLIPAEQFPLFLIFVPYQMALSNDGWLIILEGEALPRRTPRRAKGRRSDSPMQADAPNLGDVPPC
jgi:hypothetical protein